MGMNFYIFTCGVTDVSKIDGEDETTEDSEPYPIFSVLVDSNCIVTNFNINISGILGTQNDRWNFWTFGFYIKIFHGSCHHNTEIFSIQWDFLYSNRRIIIKLLTENLYLTTHSNTQILSRIRQTGKFAFSKFRTCHNQYATFRKITCIIIAYHWYLTRHNGDSIKLIAGKLWGLFHNYSTILSSILSGHIEVNCFYKFASINMELFGRPAAVLGKRLSSTILHEQFILLMENDSTFKENDLRKTYWGFILPNAQSRCTLTAVESDAVHTVAYGAHCHIAKPNVDGESTLITVLYIAYVTPDSTMMYCSARLFSCYASQSRMDRCLDSLWQATAEMVYLTGFKLRHYVE